MNPETPTPFEPLWLALPSPVQAGDRSILAVEITRSPSPEGITFMAYDVAEKPLEDQAAHVVGSPDMAVVPAPAGADLAAHIFAALTAHRKPSVRLSRLQLRARLTTPEWELIKQAALNDAAVAAAWEAYTLADYIRSDDPDTERFMALLVEKNLLSPTRPAEIFA